MHQNPIWLAFLTSIALITSWYVGHAAWELHRFSSLDQNTAATLTQWNSREDWRGRHWLEVTFTIAEHPHSLRETYPSHPFRNRWSAEQTAQTLSSQPLQAWFPSPSPELATLEKHFPWKSTLSALFLMGLLLYFCALGIYFRRRFF